MTKRFGIIVGSLRKESFNRKIASAIVQLHEEFTFQFIHINELPLFNEDLEVGGDPETVQQFKNAIEQVDGVIIVTPEYNSGMPGVLKNALDWASRPDRASVLFNKPVGLIGATPGRMGTAFSQMQIRQVLEAMHVKVLPFEKVLISQVHQKLDEQLLSDERTVNNLKKYMQNFNQWIEQHRD